MEQKGFFARVYEVVAQIPPGTVATYGQISDLIGEPGRARVVGYAMRVAPEGLPCHRVVNRTGTLAPDHVFGGTSGQRQLLEQEGIPFLADGKIDMQRCQWLMA